MSMGELVTYTVSLQSLYNTCAIRFDEVIDLIKKENEGIRNKNNQNQ